MAMQALGADRACTHRDREPRGPSLRTSLRPQLALPHKRPLGTVAQAFIDKSLIHLARRCVNTITVSFLQRTPRFDWHGPVEEALEIRIHRPTVVPRHGPLDGYWPSAGDP